MQRRKLLGMTAGGALAVAGIGAGWFALRIRTASHPHFTELGQVRQWLSDLDLSTVASTGDWSPAQIFNHCAQSLEFSLEGFPEPKPPWFQATVGRFAIAAFSGLGAMKHDLSQPVPGSDLADLDSDLPTALARLNAALDAFDESALPLKPHFAYGELTRHQFGQAHALHISEHLGELTPG